MTRTRQQGLTPEEMLIMVIQGVGVLDENGCLQLTDHCGVLKPKVAAAVPACSLPLVGRAGRPGGCSTWLASDASGRDAGRHQRSKLVERMSERGVRARPQDLANPSDMSYELVPSRWSTTRTSSAIANKR
ncbi:MAG: hypothetical protein WCP86_02265 [bacterium]